jgi:leader peptidase (prepilin peptidase)/N-methyltransferase
MSEGTLDMIMRLVSGILLGGILGSFITMLSYRLPRGRSIITPRSSCPSCQKVIEWRDLVPLYSYWRLKGHCRNCGKPFGKNYQHIEIISIIAVTLILLMYGLSAQGLMLVLVFVIGYSVFLVVRNQGRKETADDDEDDE